jgi:hypothetical protein
MNLRQMTFLVIGLMMVAALVGCGSSSKSAHLVSITATKGTPQIASVGTAFGTQLQATVTTGGAPWKGVSVTFTAPASGTSGTFADGGVPAATDIETTNSNGVATATVFTANGVVGDYEITATLPGATSPATFSMSNTTGAPASISAESGSQQTATISTAFGALLVAKVVDAFGNPVSGVSVTFTAPAAGASGTFTNGTNTETDTTGVNGDVTSTTFTANATGGGPYNVVASAASQTTANFVLTNNIPAPGALVAGNYVFSVAGTDSGSGDCTGVGRSCVQTYLAAGVISVDANGNITGGEMSFSDYNYYMKEVIYGGGVEVNPDDSNLLITINTGDDNIGPGGATGTGSGRLVFSVAMASSARGLLSEYDSWATSTGELNAQTSTAALCPSAPATPCGYAIYLAGNDSNDYPIGVGGVVTVDGAGGGISGAGSVIDVNEAGTLYPAEVVSPGSVSAPDSMGYVSIMISPSNTEVLLDGYIVDANHIRLIENGFYDGLAGTTGGTAVAQTGTGGFTASSISGATYVVGLPGADATGPLQVAGMLTFNADGTVSGNLCFNDIAAQSPQGGTAITGGTWADDGSGTGRVVVTGATDGATFSYNLTVYQTGDGQATVVSMDSTPDVLTGVGRRQASGLGVSSLTGNYTLGLDQFSSGVEFNSDGQVTANAVAHTLTGFLDVNGSLLDAGLIPNYPQNLTYFGSATSPIISVNSGNPLTLYLVDGTQGVFIENDNVKLTLGYATNQ